MRQILGLAGVLIAAALGTGALAADAPRASMVHEDYVHVPMPAGFRVEATELDGPVFATPEGKTIYIWPYTEMRNGYTGDLKNTSACTDVRTTESAGLMSPYPAGLVMPELDKRVACAVVWPPVYAGDDAKPVGKWTIITRKDGKKQWAYDEHAVYTSNLDKYPGDVIGGHTRRSGGDGPAYRDPIGPPTALPPGFSVITTARGRLLGNNKTFSVYTYDKDSADKSNCDSVCTRTWGPVLAALSAKPQGEWTIFERSPGVRQWAFRKKPLYTYAMDQKTWSVQGGDVPGWHNVYTQRAPTPPADFTTQDTESGEALADRRGMTVYIYNCGDDSADQLACDHPAAPQAFRLAICGGGDVNKCLKTWPYVVASAGATSNSRSWTVMDIDPMTGHHATPGQAGALKVWAFRDRPVYTYIGDKQPGDINGNDHGEFTGKRNGFQVFWLRDDFFNNAN